MKIIVSASKGKLKAGHKTYDCALGKHGFVVGAQGREGDGKTPLGIYTLRYGLWRNYRVVLPHTALNFRPLRQDDGWCDALGDPAYNRPVRLPYPASAERLYKDGHVYDIIIVLGHNDSPPIAGLGSAIFFHIARPEYAPTEGCVAICLDDMLALLPNLTPQSTIEIKEA